MRGWFGPVGKCGCCGGDDPPFPCECPGGGESRKFVGTPVLQVSISGLPGFLDYEWLQSYVTSWSWEITEIHGLDTRNGTYTAELPKTEDGCIDYSASFFEPPNNAPIQVKNIRRRWGSITPGTDCNYQESPDQSGNVSATVDFTKQGAAWLCQFRMARAGSFAIHGSQYLRCIDDYDSTAFDGVVNIGVTGFGDIPYDPAEGKIWFVHLPTFENNCMDQVPYQKVAIGEIFAEIIDDVP